MRTWRDICTVPPPTGQAIWIRRTPLDTAPLPAVAHVSAGIFSLVQPGWQIPRSLVIHWKPRTATPEWPLPQPGSRNAWRDPYHRPPVPNQTVWVARINPSTATILAQWDATNLCFTLAQQRAWVVPWYFIHVWKPNR